ncbi:polysaccharide biosynthesis tyrosine autokinase [Nostocales cyanobacterium LEGE 11386]|nr:polysaccharide biosynthesis tyrosine autokinase [Nostocales cyanobacterium LEGE 11386]
MKNNSSQFSSSNNDNNFGSAFPQTHAFSMAEGEAGDGNFSELLNVVRRRALVITGVSIAVMTTVIANLMLNPKQPEYESSFQMLVEPLDDERVNIVQDSNTSSSKSTLDYNSQIQVLKSPEMLGKIIRDLQTTYSDLTYSSLINSLRIAQLDETKIIRVTYRAQEPNQAQAVLDKIAQEFLEYSQEKRQTKLRQGTQFVDKELPNLQNRVDNLQKELQIFRQKYDLNTPENQATSLASQAAGLSQQRGVINLQLAQVRANLEILQGQNGRVTVLNSSPLYQQLLTQIRQLDIQIATESVRLQDANPTLQTLKEKRASLLPLLQEESQRALDTKSAELLTQLQNLEVQSQELTKIEQRLEQRRQQLPVLARQYTEIQRQLQVATDSLNRFLSTREELQIQISQTELGWQLIQAPYKPVVPVASSDVIRSFFIGLVASIVLGIGIALLIEKFDNTYHNVNALKEKIRLPLLGNIPFEKQLQSSQTQAATKKTPLVKVPNSLAEDSSSLAVVTDEEHTQLAQEFLEAVRVLHTNIQLLSSDRQIRSIIISSALPGDGKSTIAFHLAQTASAMGRRVLLVDADLRQPVIHNLAKLNNLWGLSNLISTNLPITDAIRPLPSMNQLSVLTAGPIPPDPTKLLSSEKIQRLMAEFHSTFDLVIYDAPPVLGLADASLLAPHTDGILMVVKMDKTDSSMLKQALDSLKTSRLNVLGIVGNGQKNNYSAYYYH